MAAIPVTFVGTLTYSGLEVGGGPMPGGPTVMPPIYYPPPGGGAPQPPLGIWGGAPIPWPTPPIYLPPTQPPGTGGPPLQIWGGPYEPPRIWGGPGSLPPYIWGGPWEPPPPKPDQPPSGGEGKWHWAMPPGAWVWVPAEPGKPQPTP